MGLLRRRGRKPSLYGGGSGGSMDDAVVIHAPDHYTGVAAEYEYLSRCYGRRGSEWALVSQTLTNQMVDGKRYDILTIRMKNGAVKEVVFDITQFFVRT